MPLEIMMTAAKGRGRAVFRVAAGDTVSVIDGHGRLARFRVTQLAETLTPTACVFVGQDECEQADEAVYELPDDTLEAGDFMPPGDFLVLRPVERMREVPAPRATARASKRQRRPGASPSKAARPQGKKTAR